MELQTGQHHLSPWEDDGAGNPENISRCMKIKVIRSSPHEFTNGKRCLNKLINFCDKVTGLIK